MEPRLDSTKCRNSSSSTLCSVHTPPPSRDDPLASLSGDDSSAQSEVQRKSMKRKAAEARLHRRMASAPSCRAQPAPTPGRRTSPGEEVCVLACSDCQPATGGEQLWCGMDVRLPAFDWGPAMSATGSLEQGCQPGQLSLLGRQGPQVLVVDSAAQLPRALAALRESMQDEVLGIDLEWRPSFSSGQDYPVSLMQLASSRMCLLVRLHRMGKKFPSCLEEFFRQPQTTVVGFSWDSSDEQKMQRSFGVGRALFRRFLDLQAVAAALGYQGLSLKALCGSVLGLALAKSKRVVMSNWAAPRLSDAQLRYAALDAFITGHLFRALREWHARPTPCGRCSVHLGKALQCDDLTCLDCNSQFGSAQALWQHGRQRGHRTPVRECHECQRLGTKPGGEV